MADDISSAEKEKSGSNYSLALFFPEIIPAGIFVLSAPYWSFSLFTKGFIFQAAALFCAALLSVIAFVRFIRAGCRWCSHMVIVALLSVVWLVNWSLPAEIAWAF